MQLLYIKASCKDGTIALVLNFPTLFLGLRCIFSRLITVMGIRECKQEEVLHPFGRGSLPSLLGDPYVVLDGLCAAASTVGS